MRTRLEEADQSAASVDVSGARQPLRSLIGLNTPRHARIDWKTRLEAPNLLQERPRNTDLDTEILRGDITTDVCDHVLREIKRIISFLLSSTFTDTELERNLLIDDAVPYLEDFARMRGFEFRLVEMRWGIREDASRSHRTSEICMAELERCQRESQGLSYVFLACQKYGFRPFPAKIPDYIFKMLVCASLSTYASARTHTHTHTRT